MPVIKLNEVEEKKVEMEGVVGTTKRIPIGRNEGWQDHTLRVFKIAPGGHTPKHAHDWEHINYIMSGKGRLMIDGVEHEIGERDFAVVPPNKEHQFSNPYDRDFEFICIVPNRGEY
jgi:quercetin dioxygenase-like cupin family protein